MSSRTSRMKASLPDSPSHQARIPPGATTLTAQAAASLEILNRANASAGQPRRVGYVVNVRGVRLSRATLSAGTPLIAVAVADGAAPPLRVYRVSLYVDEERVLDGSISTYVEEPEGGE